MYILEARPHLAWGGDGVHVDLLVAGALVAGPVVGEPEWRRAVVSMTTRYFVHTLDHARLQAFAAGGGALWGGEQGRV